MLTTRLPSHPVAPVTHSELMSENDVDKHDDVEENLLPSSPADVIQSPAAGGSPGPVSQEATEKVDAGYSMMASTEGLEPSLLSTYVYVSYTAKHQTVEREVEMEAGSLNIEPEVESVKLCRSVSSSDKSMEMLVMLRKLYCRLPTMSLLLQMMVFIMVSWLMKLLQCFDAVGWAAGRASGL